MPTPVLNVSQVREWEDSSWKAGRSQTEVIRRVGYLVSERAKRMLKRGDSIVAFHGAGNNGQDTLQACRLFVDHEVHRIEAIHPSQSLLEFQEVLKLRPALILDGIFGTGLNRKLDAAYQALIEAINRSGIPVLSIDIPSGLNADTGESWGAVIQAQVTLTLGAPKRGLLAYQAWPYVGRLEVAPNIGLTDCPHSSELQWTLASDFKGYPPARPAHGHKGSFGHVVIAAGSLGYHGAAVLAARGAQRAQPGLITLLTPQDVYSPVAAQLASVMVHPWTPQFALPEKCSSLLVGPGVTSPAAKEQAKDLLNRHWQSAPFPVVVDASGLDLLVPGETRLTGIRVLTPHPGEAARLLGWSTTQVEEKRPEALRALSRQFGECWVVLKGCQTLVGRCVGDLFVNPTGNPSLAQGGSGDVLAGWLAGLLAQPALQEDAGRTLRYAVWKHGQLADDLERDRPHWTIEDLATWPVIPEKRADTLPVVLPENS